MDENSFTDPKKVETTFYLIISFDFVSAFLEILFCCFMQISPVKTMLEEVSENMNVVLLPYSITSFDLLRKSISMTVTTASDLESSF